MYYLYIKKFKQIKFKTMKNLQIQHAETRLQELKYACINCHPTMKPYYQGEYQRWSKHLEELKK